MEKRTKKHAKNRRVTEWEKAAARIVLAYEQFNIVNNWLMEKMGPDDYYDKDEFEAALATIGKDMQDWAGREAKRRAERKMEAIREHPEIIGAVYDEVGPVLSPRGYAVLELLCSEYGRMPRHATS